MSFADLDRRHLWHPFTQMRDWEAAEPVVIVAGEGAVLRDETGREYLDGNSSIWTNLHGHRKPEIDAAIRAQLDRIAHSSFLGLSNDVAPRLAAELKEAAGLPEHRVFFSDDGSTAIETGLKMVFQARVQRGEPERRRFVSLGGGYHGDTIGAMSAGHSPVFHQAYKGLLFESREVMTPACYRCPYNRAKPVRGSDARATRECEWECIGLLREAFDEHPGEVAAFVAEPRVQGAGSMAMQPAGYLERAAQECRERGIWLMLDEVLTGFGRTGEMFAFQKEANVIPDLIAVAKGLTGGYLPLAATLASAEIYASFLGEYRELKTFFHGHSYCGNALGCSAARASLQIFRDEQTLVRARQIGEVLEQRLARFWEHPHVGDIRREGTICAIEIVQDFTSRQRFPFEHRYGHQICEAARHHGLLTRPIGDVLLLMPPYCSTDEQLVQMADALWAALCEVLPQDSASPFAAPTPARTASA